MLQLLQNSQFQVAVPRPLPPRSLPWRLSNTGREYGRFVAKRPRVPPSPWRIPWFSSKPLRVPSFVHKQPLWRILWMYWKLKFNRAIHATIVCLACHVFWKITSWRSFGVIQELVPTPFWWVLWCLVAIVSLTTFGHYIKCLTIGVLQSPEEVLVHFVVWRLLLWSKLRRSWPCRRGGMGWCWLAACLGFE